VGMLEEAEEEDLAHSRAQKAPEEEEEAWEGGREGGGGDSRKERWFEGRRRGRI
jgi:hypothetical protein